MKKLNTILAVGAAALMVGAMPVSVFANEVNYIPQNFAEYTIGPLWEDAGTITPYFSVSGGKAYCDATITGNNSTTKIVADISLQKRNSNGSYTTVKTWTASSSSKYLDVSNSYSISSGTYKMVVTAKIYNGSSYQTISSSTTATY